MESANLTHHILSRYNEDLDKLRNSVLQMGGVVEQQLSDAVAALLSGDSRLAEQAAQRDHEINGLEVAYRRTLRTHPGHAQSRGV